ncbi:MAG: HD domain-containing protein [Bacillota bacterium]|nr:HD domain-containing protein [Bacillota bacterium]
MMELDVVEESRRFLTGYLDGKECGYEVIHPWRKDVRYIIMHSLRVHAYAVKIAENQPTRLSEGDRIILEAAAILHDIGKHKIKKGHAYVSTEVVQNWLKDNPGISEKIGNTDKLLRVIEGHSDKDHPESEICSAILKDADILDEIGVLSIFMTSNRLDRTSPFFFNELLERTETFEVDYCLEHMNKLNTEYGRKLLRDKMDFIEKFSRQLSLELEGTEEVYESLR